MKFEIVEGGVELLPDLAAIPIAFQVHSVLEAQAAQNGLGGLRLCEQAVESPFIKDYDGKPEDRPESWPRMFDLSQWGFLIARHNGQPMGAAALAYNTAGLDLLSSRTDLCLLWDLRVHPRHRRQGVGSRLLQEAADWARARHCTQLKIETQNVNVPACRFYASQGCTLGEINRYAYRSRPDLVHEVMLVWYLDL